MSPTNSKSHSALSLVLVRLLWPMTALILWMSVTSYYESIVIFQNRIAPQPNDLETITFKIIQVSARTPNFKVQLNDGATSYFSLPDYLSLNPKGGMKMPQIAESDRENLYGCLATAKIKTEFAMFGWQKQVWDLDCPQARIHYGPDIAGNQIRERPILDLILHLIGSSMLLVIAISFIVIIRKLRQHTNRHGKEI